MATLTPELKAAYANAIQVLFGGVVQASAGDITPTVVKYVDTMMTEISKCSKAITELSFSLIYEATVSGVIGHVISKLRGDLAGTVAAELINEAVSELLQNWVTSLSSNRQFVGCLYQARANWRSAITLELMGI